MEKPVSTDSDGLYATDTGSAIQERVDTTETTPNKCRLLDLPPELRNRIYAFIYDIEDTTEFELTTAMPPTSGIALGNKHIRGEMLQLSRNAYESFWSKAHFKLTNSTTTPAHFRDCLAKNHIKDIQHIAFHISATDALRNFYKPNSIIQPRGCVLGNGEWVFKRQPDGKWWLQEPDENWRVWKVFLCWEDWAEADQELPDGIICMRQTDEEPLKEGEKGALGLTEVEMVDLLKWAKEPGTWVD